MTKKDSPTSLCESQHGQYWLNQFDPDDREIAKIFVDSLELVGESKFFDKMKDMLNRYVILNKNSALFAIRELKKGEKYFNSNSRYNASVKPLSQDEISGSEAIVSNLITKFCNSKNNDCLNHPDIGRMRYKKSKYIYLVDDLLGTGDRVIDFLENIRQCRTLLSWLSLKYINITILCYACTENARKNIETKLKKFTKYVEIIPYIDCPVLSSETFNFDKAELTNILKADILHLIKKYSIRGNINPCYWEGYKQCNAMIVFQHGCPNDTPGILWYSDKKKNWIPLFENRDTLKLGSKFANSLKNFEILENFEKFSNIDLTASKRKLILDTNFEKILIILELCSRKRRNISTLCYNSKLSHSEVKSLLKHCIKMNWLEEKQLKLTTKGLNQLKFARKFDNSLNMEIRKGALSYFPQQLREPDIG